MRLTMLRKQNQDECRQQRTLTVLGEPAQIVPWPGSEASACSQATIDLRAKRFTDRSVEPLRYEGAVSVNERSISEIVASLAATLETVEELRQGIAPDDHLVLNIQIRL